MAALEDLPVRVQHYSLIPILRLLNTAKLSAGLQIYTGRENQVPVLYKCSYFYLFLTHFLV